MNKRDQKDNNNINMGNMPNYLTEGNKTVRCCYGHSNTMSSQATFFKCAAFGCHTMLSFFAAITDKDSNYML